MSNKNSIADALWSVLLFLNIKLFTMCVRPWRYDKKGDTTLLTFWDFHIYLTYFVFLCINLVMLKSQGVFWILWSIAFEAVKSQVIETKKRYFVVMFFFYFQMLFNKDQFFWSYAIFWLTLWPTIKQIWSMLLQHTNGILWHVPTAA